MLRLLRLLRRRHLARDLASCLLGPAAVLLVAAGPAQAAPGQTGYDISYPQCSGSAFTSVPPSQGSFDILGVNGGKVYSPNPCLTAQYQWAASSPTPQVSFYANTGNPGSSSPHWPVGQLSPKYCPPEKHYRTGTTAFANCSYDYGWNAAQDSFNDAVNAIAAATPAPASPSQVAAAAGWWLDVESANSWTRDRNANASDIQGALDSLSKEGVTYEGIYTNSSSWSSITGSTRQFSGYPFWAPGATQATAAATCANAGASVTGGHIRYVQYQSGGFDNDYDCG